MLLIRPILPILTVAFTLTLLPPIASGAESQDGGKRPVKAQEVLKKLDKNKDGKISKDEFTAGRKDLGRAKAEFDKADRNDDGLLSLDEFKLHFKRMAERAARKQAERNPENDEQKRADKRWWW